MRSFYFILLVLVGSTACKKDYSVPDCIRSNVNQFKITACPHGASVKKYRFQGKDVFVFDPGNCGADMSSPVLDSDCNTLGSLGGFTGNTKINGEDFSTAVFVAVVWSRS